MNDGDWVECCTAIVEHFDGRLELIHWKLLETERAAEAARAAPLGLPAGSVAAE